MPLVAENLSKHYGDLAALKDVSLSVSDGEIHAVLGENGAGKSTLMGVLAGFIQPDRGTVRFNGVDLPFGRPAAVKRLGIEMVHQHFTLVPEFTVEENLALARLEGALRPLHAHQLAENSLKLGQELGWGIDPTAKVRDVPVGIRQRIEILKALGGSAKLLIFDEPTAVLSQTEIANLFEVMRLLKREGKTVILIAHKLREVMSVADRVTVLRKGRAVAVSAIADTNERQLAEWMVGEMPGFQQKRAPVAGEPALAVSNLQLNGNRGDKAVRDVSFEVRKGEIFGIGGVDGNGQVELAEALAGVRPADSGQVVRGGSSVGYVPQDRQSDGLALTMSIEDNLLIAGHQKRSLYAGPFLKPGRSREWCRDLVTRFEIAAMRLSDPVGSLSGGNQQKVVVGRTLEAEPEVLIAVNPTRGLDIKATNYVHGQLLRARARGAAVVLFSTDLDELSALADRTAFMSSGRFTESLEAASMLGGGS